MAGSYCPGTPRAHRGAGPPTCVPPAPARRRCSCVVPRCRGTLRSACVPAHPDWGMRRDMMSQSYTTKLDQLWSVACR
ncbi:DUF4113 domain-containing protein [Pseudomonas yamanorum]|uniref:DUF4113 domain-containing protein n=1 Tax=Pseudomonas yamanorum TaxID=515393 RepID=A0A7Y8FET0_9PSED|nr:DUF4113 domain-containing protein [Pseudomonas yamanorum]